MNDPDDGDPGRIMWRSEVPYGWQWRINPVRPWSLHRADATIADPYVDQLVFARPPGPIFVEVRMLDTDARWIAHYHDDPTVHDPRLARLIDACRSTIDDHDRDT